MFRKAVWKLSKQSFVPLLISAAYAALVYITKGANAHFTDAVSAFGASFFFCMWLVGQFIRASKQLSDSENFSKLSAGIQDINKSINELKAMPAQPTSERVRQIASAPEHLLFQGKQLVQSGYVLAGLLQAGVAFEQAVLAKAERVGLSRQSFRSFPQLLQRIEEHLGPGAHRELQTLWKFRNQIVHADAQATEELQHRPELVEFFESGFRILGADRNAF